MDNPLILSLDSHGVPHRWISWQQACFYYAKNLVAWSMGEHSFTFYGGHSRLTGERSSITANSIIAIKGRALASRGFNQVPPLNNRELFRRDRQTCAYCGRAFNYFRLTRDHITPLSYGGEDTWKNVITACKRCNNHKAGRTPEQAGMQLLAIPFVPTHAEYVYLQGKRVLADQMEFLLAHFPRSSPLHDRVSRLIE